MWARLESIRQQVYMPHQMECSRPTGKTRPPRLRLGSDPTPLREPAQTPLTPIVRALACLGTRTGPDKTGTFQ